MLITIAHMNNPTVNISIFNAEMMLDPPSCAGFTALFWAGGYDCIHTVTLHILNSQNVFLFLFSFSHSSPNLQSPCQSGLDEVTGSGELEPSSLSIWHPNGTRTWTYSYASIQDKLLRHCRSHSAQIKTRTSTVCCASFSEPQNRPRPALSTPCLTLLWESLPGGCSGSVPASGPMNLGETC